MDDEKREQHESYGLIGLYRTSGDPGPLFGSSISHQNYVTLRIRRAEKIDRVGGHRTYGRQDLIEVMLSNTQFADLITSFGQGDGVPCTLHRVGGQRMARCPDYDQRAKFEADFKASARKATGNMGSLIEGVRTVFAKPNVTKADRAEVMGLLARIQSELDDAQPFIQSQLNEAMDKTVTEAKGEVEAFVQNKIVSLGIEALRDQFGSPQLDTDAGASLPELIEQAADR